MLSSEQRRHVEIEERLAVLLPDARPLLRYDADEGAFSVRLDRADGGAVEIEVATGVWPDGMDDGEEAKARALSEFVARAPADIAWLLQERVRLLALLADAEAEMSPPRQIPPLESGAIEA